MSDAVIYQRSQYPFRNVWLLWLAAGLLILAINTVAYAVGRRGMTAEDMVFSSVFLSVPLALWLLHLKVTVTVTFTELRLAFLLGWPRKRINRSDIRSVTPVHDWTRDARAVRRSNYYMWLHNRQGILIVLVGGKSVMVCTDDSDTLVSVLNV